MNKLSKILVMLFAAGLLLIAQANALDLAVAKSQGLIGERNDGYLGYVVTPPSDEVMTLVKEVNNKRKEKFAETAAKTNTTIEQVAYRFYERAVELTDSGNYYHDANGVWMKKP